MDLSKCFLHTLGETEGKKLEQLRAILPDALAKAARESEDVAAKGKFELWKANLEVHDDASGIVLLKYLRAEELDVEKAADRVAGSLVFRAECCIDELKTAEMPPEFLGHDYLPGKDSEGRPVMISRFGGMDVPKVFASTEAFIRYRTKLMEQAIDQLTFQKGDPEDLVQVHDYSGLLSSMFNSDVKNAVTAISKVFERHYPEYKGKTVFANFPNFFAAPFKAMANLLPERTRKKFVVLGTDDHAALFEHLSPDLIPVGMGGLWQESRKLSVHAQAVVVKARDNAEVTLLKLDAPAKVAWELRVCRDEVSYEVFFVPSGGGDECEIQKSEAGKYVKAEDGVISGEWSATAAGEVRCRFRNECAWFRKRVCPCRAGTIS